MVVPLMDMDQLQVVYRGIAAGQALSVLALQTLRLEDLPERTAYQSASENARYEAVALHTVDLHGFTVDDAIREFVRRCNTLFKGGYRGDIVVVHGYGSSGQGGAIKERLKGFLSRHADFFDAPAWNTGNPGATMLRQLKLLPAAKAGGMHQQILDFLVSAKTEPKILARFHSRPMKEIRAILQELRRDGLIAETQRNGQKAWLAMP